MRAAFSNPPALALALGFAFAGAPPAGAQTQPSSVHCQIEADGKCHCGPRRGTGRQIPCRPEFVPGVQPPAAPAKQNPPRAAMMLSGVERCTARWQHHFDWATVKAAPVHSQCKRAGGDDFTLDGHKYLPLRTMRDVAALVFDNYGKAPILIGKVDGTRNRYLVALSGTEFKARQATGLLEDIAASINHLDGYSLFVLSALVEYDDGRGVPPGSELLLVGHSLGGMVAQNVAGNRQRFFHWKPVRVITLGSPKTTFLPQALPVRLFAGKGDPVVSLSAAAAFGLFEQIWIDSGARGKGWALGFEHHLNYPSSVDLPRFNASGD
jgi:hypothetical protein